MKKENKNIVVHVRLTADEHRSLLSKAEKSGLTVSEVIRVSCKRKELKNRLTEEEIVFFRQLINLKNTLVWLNNAYKAGDFATLKIRNIELLNELQTLMLKFL